MPYHDISKCATPRLTYPSLLCTARPKWRYPVILARTVSTTELRMMSDRKSQKSCEQYGNWIRCSDYSDDPTSDWLWVWHVHIPFLCFAEWIVRHLKSSILVAQESKSSSIIRLISNRESLWDNWFSSGVPLFGSMFSQSQVPCLFLETSSRISTLSKHGHLCGWPKWLWQQIDGLER